MAMGVPMGDCGEQGLKDLKDFGSMTDGLVHTTGKCDFDVIIVGGGLAGLVCAIELGRAGKHVLLIEKKTYPYHKVCGEYVSNEVLPYLQSLGFDPFQFGASRISRLRISTPSGKNVYAPLDLGAFGLSRYTMDFELSELAKRTGAKIMTHTKVMDVQFTGDHFEVKTATEKCTAKLVIGSWGKRETLDKKLNRKFVDQHTGYMAVKYHIRTDYPVDEIGLDNFERGYCGISKIEGDRYNLCYLYHRKKEEEKQKTIADYEAMALHKNPVLKTIFTQSDFLFDAPVVINQISFASKPLIEDHVLMCGDTAGLITPLCGNGMSMAIGAAKMLTGLILELNVLEGNVVGSKQRLKLEEAYRRSWSKQFRQRLFWGRTIQRFFGNTTLTEGFVRLMHALPPVERKLISATHGKPIL